MENLHPPVRKIRGTRAEDPRHYAQPSVGARVEQSQNSLEKVKFAVSCTVYQFQLSFEGDNEA